MILALTGFPLVVVSIIAFAIIISVIISIHEFGHFFFARKAGILCHEFSIGMGPIIYKKKFGETMFCIRISWSRMFGQTQKRPILRRFWMAT